MIERKAAQIKQMIMVESHLFFMYFMSHFPCVKVGLVLGLWWQIIWHNVRCIIFLAPPCVCLILAVVYILQSQFFVADFFSSVTLG